MEDHIGNKERFVSMDGNGIQCDKCLKHVDATNERGSRVVSQQVCGWLSQKHFGAQQDKEGTSCTPTTSIGVTK